MKYSPIAFDERVTFWLQCTGSLPCVCVFAALYVCLIVMTIREPHAQIMQHTHTHAVNKRV